MKKFEMGIGDWAQSPIPNPQSPNPQSPLKFYFYIYKTFLIKIFFVK